MAEQQSMIKRYIIPTLISQFDAKSELLVFDSKNTCTPGPFYIQINKRLVVWHGFMFYHVFYKIGEFRRDCPLSVLNGSSMFTYPLSQIFRRFSACCSPF